MCIFGSQQAPMPTVPNNAAEEEARAAAEAKQKLKNARANATGIRSTINPETGFLGVSDEDPASINSGALSPSTNSLIK